jgi:hypothetical protein
MTGTRIALAAVVLGVVIVLLVLGNAMLAKPDSLEWPSGREEELTPAEHRVRAFWESEFDPELAIAGSKFSLSGGVKGGQEMDVRFEIATGTVRNAFGKCLASDSLVFDMTCDGVNILDGTVSHGESWSSAFGWHLAHRIETEPVSTPEGKRLSARVVCVLWSRRPGSALYTWELPLLVISPTGTVAVYDHN